jgi:hypothetical protein
MGPSSSLKGTHNRKRDLDTGKNHTIRQAVYGGVMKRHFIAPNGFVKKKIHKMMDISSMPPQNIVVG